MMTEGERHFVDFCLKYQFDYRPIQENPRSKNPDYELFPDKTPIIIEIKDIENNPEEKQAINDIASKGFAVWGSSRVGSKIRNKIKDAHLQLKEGSNQSPTILLIFDDRNECVSVLSPYEIAVAMYGYETLVLNIDRSVSRRFGGGKQMTSSSRQYISAVGILNANLTIRLFLNWYTARSLPSSPLTKCPAVTMYALQREPRTNFDAWTEVQNIDEQIPPGGC